MFKNDTASPAVGAILEAIFELSVIPGLKPNTAQPKPPRVSCVTENSATTYRDLDLGYDPWQTCLTGDPTRNPIPAFVAEGTRYIFLCPLYFVLEEAPLQAHCPTLHLNRFAGDPNIFYQKYQIYTMIYQLVRFYLGENALDKATDPKEQFDWNNCVTALDTLDSVRNPTNMEIYVASKCDPVALERFSPC